MSTQNMQGRFSQGIENKIIDIKEQHYDTDELKIMLFKKRKKLKA